MDSDDLGRREWLGVIGAAAVCALVTAMAMPWPAKADPSRTAPAERPVAARTRQDPAIAPAAPKADGKRLAGRVRIEPAGTAAD